MACSQARAGPHRVATECGFGRHPSFQGVYKLIRLHEDIAGRSKTPPDWEWGLVSKRRHGRADCAQWQMCLLRLHLDVPGDLAPMFGVRSDPHRQQVRRHCVTRTESELRQALDKFAVLYDLVYFAVETLDDFRGNTGRPHKFKPTLDDQTGISLRYRGNI